MFLFMVYYCCQEGITPQNKKKGWFNYVRKAIVFIKLIRR